MTDLTTGEATMKQRPTLKPIYRVLGVIATLFGVMTLKEGGSVLFFDGPAREAAGNVVPFVLMFNFASGFLYVLTGAGIFLGKGWARQTAAILAFSCALVLASLGVYILMEQPFEMRTVIAMTIRTGFWITLALVMRHAAKNHLVR